MIKLSSRYITNGLGGAFGEHAYSSIITNKIVSLQ